MADSDSDVREVEKQLGAAAAGGDEDKKGMSGSIADFVWEPLMDGVALKTKCVFRRENPTTE